MLEGPTSNSSNKKVQLLGFRCLAYLIMISKLFRELVKWDQGDNSARSFFSTPMICAALPEAANMALDVACFAVAQKTKC